MCCCEPVPCWWSRASCHRMSVDIVGTNCDQCRSTVQCCFTSTETVRLIGTESPGRPPRLLHSSWTRPVPCMWLNCFIWGPRLFFPVVLVPGGLLGNIVWEYWHESGNESLQNKHALACTNYAIDKPLNNMLPIACTKHASTKNRRMQRHEYNGLRSWWVDTKQAHAQLTQ